MKYYAYYEIEITDKYGTKDKKGLFFHVPNARKPENVIHQIFRRFYDQEQKPGLFATLTKTVEKGECYEHIKTGERIRLKPQEMVYADALICDGRVEIIKSRG